MAPGSGRRAPWSSARCSGSPSISSSPGSRMPLLGEAILFAAGFVQSFCMVPMAVILLRVTDPAFRGRVMGVRMLAVYGLPLGLLLSGPLVEHAGFAVDRHALQPGGHRLHAADRRALAGTSLARVGAGQRAARRNPSGACGVSRVMEVKIATTIALAMAAHLVGQRPGARAQTSAAAAVLGHRRRAAQHLHVPGRERRLQPHRARPIATTRAACASAGCRRR